MCESCIADVDTSTAPDIRGGREADLTRATQIGPSAIVGMRNPKQVFGVIGAASFRLSSKEFEEIEEALQQEVAAIQR